MAKRLLVVLSLGALLVGLPHCADAGLATDAGDAGGAEVDGTASGARGAACASDAECAAGLACLRVYDLLQARVTLLCDGVDWFGARRCFPPQAGTSCNGPGECAEGLTCVVQTATDSIPTACLPLGTKGDGCCTFAEDPHGSSFFTIDSTCGDGLSCGEASECVVASNRGRGVRCESDEECADGLVCVRVSGIVDLSLGGNCNDGADNDWFALSRCLEAGGGHACGANSDCSEGLTCVTPNVDSVDEQCLPLGQLGDTCCVHATDPLGNPFMGIESTCEEEFICDSTGQCMNR